MTEVAFPPTQINMLDEWRKNHYIYKERFQSHQSSFIHNLLPEIAVQLNIFEVLGILQHRLGTEVLQKALDPNQIIQSPVAHNEDSSWLKKSNMVGINVRTIGNFFNIVKYALTIPASQDSIHLLPIWEPGVVGSLYGMVSFNINPEFFSPELARTVPLLNTVEKQLKATINLLHALGKSVGMDAIPHTDRFSEMVIAYPRFFEWVRRVGGRIMNQSEHIYREIEEIIWLYLHRNGTANGTPLSYSRNVFFSPNIPILTDEQRSEILFGFKTDAEGRLRRRIEIIQDIIDQGFETLPMTMAPPYRSLHIKPDDYVLDERGNRWYTYEFDYPQPMSRVFGPLVRYKFFHSKNDNADWELDFDNPNVSAWDFFCQKYEECQRAYNFDFIRGDMAHIQPRPMGVPKKIGKYYDPLLAIKKKVQTGGTLLKGKKISGVPYFAFFAETFLVEPDFMGYGDESDHLEAIKADSTLGDLQSCVVGSHDFSERFFKYYNLLKTKAFAPNFTVMTADKDDPRFDEFYRTANHFRMFVALFLTDMPSYVGLGFEVRNLHLTRGKNEEYSKLYVFKIEDDNEYDKVTHGSFIWGQNFEQFALFQQMKELTDLLWNEINGKEIRWLLTPTETQKMMVWSIAENAKYVFVANASQEGGLDENVIREITFNQPLQLIFDTTSYSNKHICRIYAFI